MKILILTNHTNATDGWSRYSRDLAVELQRQRHDVLMLVAESSGGVHEQVMLEKPHAYLSNIWTIFRSARNVNNVISTFKPDVIHVAVEPYGHMLPFLKAERVKTILTVHGTYSYMPRVVTVGIYKLLCRIMTLRMYEQVHAVVSVSDYTKNYLLAHIPPQLRGALESKTCVIHNGIDLSVFSTQALKKADKEVKDLLFVGAVKARKGLLEAVRALAAYKSLIRSPFIFRIVGDYNPADTYVLELQRLIAEHALGEEVVLEGRVGEDRLRQLYQNADLFIMLSVADPSGAFEGFGLTYLEANAFGVPAIGPDDSGARDAISEGVSGYRVNVHKPPEVARIISRVLDEKKITAEGCFGWAREHAIALQVEKLLALYR